MANDKAIVAISTTQAAQYAPTAVLARAQKSWPAPTPTPGIAVSETDGTALAIGPRRARTVIGASIFGGPVTAGDPESVTQTISPYTRKDEDPHPALEPEEGFRDVFGMQHGAEAPEESRWGRGSFDVATPMGAFDITRDTMMKVREYQKRQQAAAAETFFEKNKVAIGIGAVAAIGLGAWYFTKKK